MHKNVEIFHQGWLVKSPPTPRGIFRARWRRRWFTLKQGELPGQFFLEYYTDMSCRKRKGIIDLDQVEQVDAGLRLDRQSIKFQHMFDMKTPNRTYYLSAESSQDMRDWVMVICQVCNLQETEEKNGADSSTVQYYNVGPNADFEAKEIPQNEQSTGTETSTLTNTSQSALSNRFDQLSIVNEYENDNAVTYRQSEYSNRSTLMASEMQNNNEDAGLNYSNLPHLNTMERPQGLARVASSNAKSTGAVKKIPENLKLRSDDKINNNNAEEMSMYRASGPYIPLSDCFSGSPVLFKNENDPKTPLNSLDPKFYDTPRSHITNIGLNLTDDQPNSPKRNNIQAPITTAPKFRKNVARSVNSSPTDSEGGSTDDDWMEPKIGGRKTRPSDSSMENESIAITAGQCYMKMGGNPIPLPPKRISLVEKKQESSDTEENASPLLMQIGPKDSSSCVDERYDFPRSYNIQGGFTGSHMNIGTNMGSMSSIHGHGHLMTSTPNLIHSGASTLERSQMNFYSNAAPRDNNIFRFDFTSTASPPEVNRTLKPRKDRSNGYGSIRSIQTAPTVNRMLKPGTLSKPQLAIGTNSLKRRGPESLSLSEVDNPTLEDSLVSNQSFGVSPKTPNKSDVRLEYLDLDHETAQKSILGSVASMSVVSNTMSSLDMPLNGSIREGPGVAYTSIDVLKTDAFNRTREDSEMTRARRE